MEISSKRTMKINLYLNENEATWLKWYMQNFIGGDNEVEGKRDSAMREKLFDLLNEELEGT